MDATVMVAIAGFLSALAGSGVTLILSRRKAGAEADLTIGQAWERVVTQQRTDIEDLRARMTRAETSALEAREERDKALRDLDQVRADLARLTSENARLVAGLARLTAENAKLVADMAHLAKDNAAFAADLDILVKRIEELEAQLLANGIQPNGTPTPTPRTRRGATP